MAFYYQSTAYRRGFFMYDSSTHASPLANAAPIVTISKAGASFVYAGGVTTEVPGFGYYTVALTTTDTATVGDLGFNITGTGASISQFIDQVLAGVQVATVVQTVKDDIVSAIWATPVRSITEWGGIVSAVWATPVRALGVAGQTAVSQETTNAVWATPTRTLSQAAYDQLVNQVWATPVRTLTSAGAATVDTTAVIAIASGVWDQQRSTRNASGSFGNLVQTFGVTVATNLDKTEYALTQAANDQIVNAVWATAVRTVTGGTVTSVASPVAVASNYDKGNYTLSTTAVTAVADGWLNRDMSSGTDSGSTTVRTPRQALRFLRNKWSVADGTATLTVTKEDDSTASWTSELATSSSAAPVVGSDPAGP